MGKTHNVDVAIIGAGTAGLNALHQVLQKTTQVALIDSGPFGTTCARAGCMPAETFITLASTFATSQVSPGGLHSNSSPQDRCREILQRVRATRDVFVGQVSSYVNDLEKYLIRGKARFLEPTLLAVDDSRVRARKIVIATGSHPIVPAKLRNLGTLYVTTDTLFDLETLPPKMAVLGCDSIGASLAQAFAKIGIEVVVIPVQKQIAGLTDPAVIAVLENQLQQNLKIEHERSAEFEKEDETHLAIRFASRQISANLILVNIGRAPNIQNLDLENIGIDPLEHETWNLDISTMRLGDLPIYMAGDASSFQTILHEAADDGAIAGINAASSQDTSFERRVPLRISYCTPQVATVGASFAELNPEQAVCGERNFENLPGAITEGENKGLMRIYASKKDGLLLGAEMAVPGAEHLAHLLAFAIDRKCTAAELLHMPFYHPTLEEGLADALRSIVAQTEGENRAAGVFLRKTRNGSRNE